MLCLIILYLNKYDVVTIVADFLIIISCDSFDFSPFVSKGTYIYCHSSELHNNRDFHVHCK